MKTIHYYQEAISKSRLEESIWFDWFCLYHANKQKDWRGSEHLTDKMNNI